jgi:hypothetical protein
MANTAIEHSEALKQISLRGKIAIEKTKQLSWQLRSEKQNTSQAKIRYHQSEKRTAIEREREKATAHQLSSAKHQTEQASLSAQTEGVKVKIARDSLTAANTEHGLKQMLLREQLTQLALQASDLKQANSQNIALSRKTFNRPPELKSIHFLTGGK